MKYLLILAFATLGFTSCNDSGDKNTTTDTTTVVKKDTVQVEKTTTVETDTVDN